MIRIGSWDEGEPKGGGWSREVDKVRGREADATGEQRSSRGLQEYTADGGVEKEQKLSFLRWAGVK